MGKGKREGLYRGWRALLKAECGDGITGAYLGQKPFKLYILSMCDLLYVNCTSLKLYK